jgi:hypothetical protein
MRTYGCLIVPVRSLVWACRGLCKITGAPGRQVLCLDLQSNCCVRASDKNLIVNYIFACAKIVVCFLFAAAINLYLYNDFAFCSCSLSDWRVHGGRDGLNNLWMFFFRALSSSYDECG